VKSKLWTLVVIMPIILLGSQNKVLLMFYTGTHQITKFGTKPLPYRAKYVSNYNYSF